MEPFIKDTILGTAREKRIEGYRVEINPSGQVLGLSLPEETTWSEDELGEPELSPTPATEAGFISGAMLAHKAKEFDDGLYAAAEVGLQSGWKHLIDKRGLLYRLMRVLKNAEAGPGRTAAQVLFGAARLGGLDMDPPGRIENAVTQAVSDFMSDPRLSKPIGIYTWSDELVRIFRQDRMLQQPMRGAEELAALAEEMSRSPELVKVYGSCLALMSGLTNPPVENMPNFLDLIDAWKKDDRAALETEYRFWPPSTSPETELVKQLDEMKSTSGNFDLAAEMAARIRDGRLDLSPDEKSGWYAYTLWALEPLVVPDRTPEASRLILDDEYCMGLEGLFRACLAMSRETHIKQLEIPLAAAEPPDEDARPQIPVYPELTLEPLCTYFLRRAVGYRFVRTVLEKHLGIEWLEMSRRFCPGWKSRLPLDEELRRMEGLFLGAYAVSARELGLRPTVLDGQALLGSGRGIEEDAAMFLAWAEMGGDDDLEQDARMMVPVYYDVRKSMTKVWAVLGWARRTLVVRFVDLPEVRVFDASGHDVTANVDIVPREAFYSLAYPVTAEVYVNKLLNRDQFRAHCDRHKTTSAILQNL
jgi:hypothetical protein